MTISRSKSSRGRPANLAAAVLAAAVLAAALLAPNLVTNVSAQAISANEIVYAQQKTVNSKPYFELRSRSTSGTADRKLFGGCLAGLTPSYCTYADPAVSPDANRVAFVFEPVSEEFCKAIWIASISGSRARQVSAGCSDRRPVWSPDGRKIAYEAGNAIYEVELCRNTLPERSPRRVASGSRPSYSRDGRWIAYARSGDIFKMRSTGGTEVNVTADSHMNWDPQWTKPGTLGSVDKIIFLSNRDGGTDAYTIDAAGGSVSRVTRSGTSKSTPDLPILPLMVTWQEGANIMLGGGTATPQVMANGKGPRFGYKASKVTICP